MIYKTNFKNYLFALLTISMILSCNKSEITEVIIQGNIVNPMGNTIQLVGPSFEGHQILGLMLLGHHQ